MKKLTFLFIISCCLLSCSNSNIKDLSNKNEYSISEVNDINSPSLSPEFVEVEQKKAIGNIMFGIGEKQFEKEKNKFFKKCERPDRTFGSLGDYEFSYVSSEFYNGKLFLVQLHEFGSNNIYERKEIEKKYTTLYELLKTKYNEPSIKKDIPDLQISRNKEHLLARWDIGKKAIEIILIGVKGEVFSIHLRSYLPEIKKLKEKKQEKQEKQEQKEAKAKAVDML